MKLAMDKMGLCNDEDQFYTICLPDESDSECGFCLHSETGELYSFNDEGTIEKLDSSWEHARSTAIKVGVVIKPIDI